MSSDNDKSSAAPTSAAETTKRSLPQRIRSTDLFRAAHEVIIEHADHEYRLRITSQNKLILTK